MGGPDHIYIYIHISLSLPGLVDFKLFGFGPFWQSTWEVSYKPGTRNRGKTEKDSLFSLCSSCNQWPPQGAAKGTLHVFGHLEREEVEA